MKSDMRSLAITAFFASWLVLSPRAFAAGYNCVSVDQDMQVIVTMDAAQAAEAKHITFIDPTLSKRTQVLAVFSDESLKSETMSDGLRFIADAKAAASGKRLGGTKASLLDKVVVEVQTVTKKMKIQEFSEGSMYAAQVSYVKKNGTTLKQDFDCALFLGDDAPVAGSDAFLKP